jgi:lipid II:glycine glycyltransferase (peptidoglycan interpeptide bridge formation enzyme)
MNDFQIGLPPEDWDQRQELRGGHILQGRPWACFQLAYGRQIVWAEDTGWSWFGIVNKLKGISYLYVPYGPTALSDNDFKIALSSLKSAALSLGLDFVRFEPFGQITTEVLSGSDLIKVKSVQPQNTLDIDLLKDEIELRTNLTSGHRNTINGVDRRGVTLRKSSDLKEIDTFLKLIHATSDSRHFQSYPDAYYRILAETLIPTNNAEFFIAEHDGLPISIALCLNYRKTRVYAYAGNDPASRNLRAAVPLVWKIILESKNAGFEHFDLWGVSPNATDKTHPWSGFSEFKRSFGGSEISYLGTYELPINKSKYKLYRFIKKLMS